MWVVETNRCKKVQALSLTEGAPCVDFVPAQNPARPRPCRPPRARRSVPCFGKVEAGMRATAAHAWGARWHDKNTRSSGAWRARRIQEASSPRATRPQSCQLLHQASTQDLSALTVNRGSGVWYVMPVTSHADVESAAAGASAAATARRAMASFIGIVGWVCV